MDLVVANELQSRRKKIFLYRKDHEKIIYELTADQIGVQDLEQYIIEYISK